MNIRNKVTIIVIGITLVFIVVSNGVFSSFFSDYLTTQEDSQINSISKSTASYFEEKMLKYESTVNDYSHWDDAYDFLNDKNKQEYITSNLVEDTFSKYIEANFIFYIKENGSICYKQYYDDVEQEFTPFPNELDVKIEDFIKRSSPKDNGAKIIKFGERFYIIAVSEVTDSKSEKEPNGRMLIGREIDDNMLGTINQITDSKIYLTLINSDSSEIKPEFLTKQGFTPALVRINKEKDTLQAELIIPNTSYQGATLLITIIKPRDFFISGMNQIYNFMLFYSVIMFLILLILFHLLGRYITQPFVKLLNDVKNLDLTKNEFQRLETNSKGEFAFLRYSVNQMLNKIEVEQCKVRENKEKLYATLKSVGDGVIAVDRDGIVNFINPVAERLTGYNQEAGVGASFETVFKIINEHTREKVESPVQKVFETEEIIELANHTILISKDGTERAIEDTAAPIKDTLGNIIGVVIVFRDFSDKKEKRRQIEYLSYHDQLTGLYNRRFFEEELKRLDTNRNLPLSFVFADVNGLKTINDAFGHQAGDELIKIVSDVFKKTCRADDIISRTGGDEFVILLPNTDLDLAQMIANRLKEKIEQSKIMEINISVSFGWDTKNNVNENAQEVLKRAEDLMYEKKIFHSASKRNAVIKSILNTLHLKNPREEAHSKRVSIICEEIGKAYNLSNDELRELRIAGELHDIGKIAIDEVVLNKSSKLSEAEWSQIKHHPEIGYRLLATSSEYFSIAEYVLAHHERWDGKGYPKGLKGEAIHWKARVIAIADAYDAMTCERTYRKALTKELAVAEIKRNMGRQFDPEIAKVFIERIVND